MYKCYVTKKAVDAKEHEAVQQKLSEGDNYETVTAYYCLVRLEGEDNMFTADGDVVLSMEAVDKALNDNAVTAESLDNASYVAGKIKASLDADNK